jgi:hypothetical protein
MYGVVRIGLVLVVALAVCICKDELPTEAGAELRRCAAADTDVFRGNDVERINILSVKTPVDLMEIYMHWRKIAKPCLRRDSIDFVGVKTPSAMGITWSRGCQMMFQRKWEFGMPASTSVQDPTEMRSGYTTFYIQHHSSLAGITRSPKHAANGRHNVPTVDDKSTLRCARRI